MSREIGIANAAKIGVLPVGSQPLSSSLDMARVLFLLAASGLRQLAAALRPEWPAEPPWVGVSAAHRNPADSHSPRRLIPLFLLRQDEPDEDEEAEESYIEIVPVDPGDREGTSYLLDEETTIGFLAVNEGAEALEDEEAGFTADEEIAEDFAERQRLAYSGRQELVARLAEEFPDSPIISGGDIDAAWDEATVGGEETVGGTAPTPDQDVVDELGEAAGLIYAHDVPLNSAERLAARDQDRWELNPESAADQELVEEGE